MHSDLKKSAANYGGGNSFLVFPLNSDKLSDGFWL